MVLHKTGIAFPPFDPAISVDASLPPPFLEPTRRCRIVRRQARQPRRRLAATILCITIPHLSVVAKM